MPQRDRSQLDLSPQHLATLLDLLKRHVPDAQVWAFGSRVTGDAHECSDLDLVLRNPQDLMQPVSGWFDLKEALQESNLPILVEVHDWAHLPDQFHRNMERCYIVLQAGGARGSGDVAEVGRAGVTIDGAVPERDSNTQVALARAESIIKKDAA